MFFKKTKPKPQIDDIIVEKACNPEDLLDQINNRLQKNYRLYGNVIHWTQDNVDIDTQITKTTHIFSVYMIKEK